MPGLPWKECPPQEGVFPEGLEAEPQKPTSHILQNLGKQPPVSDLGSVPPRASGPVCKGSTVRVRHLSMSGWPGASPFSSEPL